MSWFLIYTSIAWLIRAGMVPVVLRRQFAPGASLAWLGIVFLHPYIGLTLYLLVGETRLGPRRVKEHRRLVEKFRRPEQGGVGDGGSPGLELHPAYEPMILQAQKISGLPVLPGNSVEFLTTAPQMVDRLVADIDTATSTAHLLYYMFERDSAGMRVAEALCNAARRGVKCRVLADAVASRAMFHRRGMARMLREAGVEVAAALPVALLKRRLPRMDLRNHRKLAVIDGRIGYAGSHNLVHPDYGGRRGHPWIDLTGRFTGPVVDELAIVFHEDWEFETSEELPIVSSFDLSNATAGSPMQAVPTGPSAPGETYRRVLLAAVQCARSRLTLTTPYFVPDEPTLVALMMAADRGVDVKLLLPKVPDHIFTAAAGRAHFARLMDAGVGIFLYRPGLLHSKTTTVDDAFAVVGSANLDVRSFNLNFELSMLLYGREATDRVRAVQESYLADCDRVDKDEWSRRPYAKKMADGAISLMSPLL